MFYRSKKDPWLFGLVWGVTVALLLAGILVVLVGNPQLGWSLFRDGVVTAAVLVITTYPLDYEIAGTQIVARCGFMRWRVPLDSIQEVRPSRNPASAPAWSLDRLRIEYLKGTATRALYISPEDKHAFMRDLVDEAPGLELVGDRVVRRV
jgi:Bacterial PH domain